MLPSKFLLNHIYDENVKDEVIHLMFYTLYLRNISNQ